MKRMIWVTIALGFIGLSIVGCSSFLPKPKPDPSKIFVLFSPIEATERQDSDPLGRFRSASVRSDYLHILTGER